MDISATFEQQFGAITRAQALGLGLSSSQISYRVRSGAWIKVQPKVYRLAGVPGSWELDLFAACASTGGVISHRCAAALWKLDVYDKPPIEITVPEGRSVRVAVDRIHESRQWHLRNETVRSGLPVTGIERTILDCAGVVGLGRAERLAEAAIRKEMTSWLRLADALKDHSARGRNGCLTLRQLLQIRLGNGTVPLSDFSRRVVQLLEKANIAPPVVEYRITDGAGRHILQVDLAWPHLKKAWELDGLEFHFGRSDIERDRRKRNAVVAEGWVIQEILWSMYVDNPRQLVHMAKKFLDS